MMIDEKILTGLSCLNCGRFYKHSSDDKTKYHSIFVVRRNQFCSKECYQNYLAKMGRENKEPKRTHGRYNTKRLVVKAYTAVSIARAKGLIKSKKCIICGKRKTHGHHADYRKPLELTWLCLQHHRDVHSGIINI